MKLLDVLFESTPRIANAFLFHFKARAFQLQRFLKNLLSAPAKRHLRSDRLIAESILAESSTPLFSIQGSAELPLEAGKVHNLRIALRTLDGVEVPANSTFSFWAQVGYPGALKGFVRGRELREGCLIPSVAGGLCQLSNALYDVALQGGFTIVERHKHSQIIPGSLAEIDRDATVFWNYVDLRFKSTTPFRIEASMTADHLKVRFKGCGVGKQVLGSPLILRRDALTGEPESCATCSVDTCFRHVGQSSVPRVFGRTAFLVDECWPEFDRYVQSHRTEQDIICVPLDGRRYSKPNYAWNMKGFTSVRQSRLATFRRAVELRRLASQGAARQRALLKHDELMARSFASALSYDVTHVVVMQNLLPFLWRDGHLGGRTFDVLMTRFPIEILQERLDNAAELHPESRTLADFRADDSLARAEREALGCARTVVTPHTEIARLFGPKARRLEWALPPATTPPRRGTRIIFPASTLGRKGAYELRAAARNLELEIVLVGAELEEHGFWSGMRTSSKVYDETWLDEASAVVLPSFVEHQPRRLLQAVQSGVPVIASSACGLAGLDGVISIPEGDVGALQLQLMKLDCRALASSTFTESDIVHTAAVQI